MENNLYEKWLRVWNNFKEKGLRKRTVLLKKKTAGNRNYFREKMLNVGSMLFKKCWKKGKNEEKRLCDLLLGVKTILRKTC